MSRHGVEFVPMVAACKGRVGKRLDAARLDVGLSNAHNMGLAG